MVVASRGIVNLRACSFCGTGCEDRVVSRIVSREDHPLAEHMAVHGAPAIRRRERWRPPRTLGNPGRSSHGCRPITRGRFDLKGHEESAAISPDVAAAIASLPSVVDYRRGGDHATGAQPEPPEVYEVVVRALSPADERRGEETSVHCLAWFGCGVSSTYPSRGRGISISRRSRTLLPAPSAAPPCHSCSPPAHPGQRIRHSGRGRSAHHLHHAARRRS
ncbi:MAG: hypothetical protein QOF33_2919 [Thermomicrobiales bacterium]|nr:hypothetical protein [Thermomicrobiales bacterium]